MRRHGITMLIIKMIPPMVGVPFFFELPLEVEVADNLAYLHLLQTADDVILPAIIASRRASTKAAPSGR